MAKVRCEELVSRGIAGALSSSLSIAAIDSIGAGNTEVTPSGSSQIAFGPAAKEMDVYIRNFGGQVYVTKGSGVPQATSANGTLLSAGEYIPVHLIKGESIAVITAAVA